MIRISLKGLAKFMTSNAAQQRKVLRDFKYPDPEGHAQAMYYREARDLIVAYHKKSHNQQWLTDQAATLNTLAQQSSGQTQARLGHNARALCEYGRHFGLKRFDVLSDVNLVLRHHGVNISVVADLHVRERQDERLIKLEFAKMEPDEKVKKVISQAMLEAETTAGLGLPSSSVLYYDVPRGRIHKCARTGSRLSSEIQAACQNIAAIWKDL